MSGLTYTGVGLVIVTATGLAVKGLQALKARESGLQLKGLLASGEGPVATNAEY